MTRTNIRAHSRNAQSAIHGSKSIIGCSITQRAGEYRVVMFEIELGALGSMLYFRVYGHLLDSWNHQQSTLTRTRATEQVR